MYRVSSSAAVLGLLLPHLFLISCGGTPRGPIAAEEVGTKYPISLNRDEEPGKVYHVRLREESTKTLVARSQGRIVKEENENQTFTFVGTRKKLSAGKRQPTEYVVEELTRTSGSQKDVLLPPGTTIRATHSEAAWRYTVDGQPTPESIHEILSSLMGGKTSDDEKGTDDAIFGSKEPRAVGERWSVNVAALPVEEEFEVDLEGASGSTRVAALRNVDGIECLEIEAELSCPKLHLKTMPADANVHSAAMSAQFLGLFPTDTRLPSLSTGMTFELVVSMDVATPQGPVRMDMTAQTAQTTNRD